MDSAEEGRPAGAGDAAGRIEDHARPPLTPAARRALAEAQARRAEQDRRTAEFAAVPEKDGRDGPEPVRYGDWEVKGVATDF
jgi:hypothetical protein